MRADPRCFLSTVTGNRQQHKVRERFSAKNNNDGRLSFDEIVKYKIPPEAGFPPKGKFMLKVYQVTEEDNNKGGGGEGKGGEDDKIFKGVQLSELALDDHRGLIFGSEYEDIEDNQILDRGYGVNKQHVAIWYSQQRQRMMIEAINGTTIIYSITKATGKDGHDGLIKSDKYVLSNKIPNTPKLQLTALDGKKALTADKCIFTISSNNKGMKLYFIEGTHCGVDKRIAERQKEEKQKDDDDYYYRIARRGGGDNNNNNRIKDNRGVGSSNRRIPRDDIVLQHSNRRERGDYYDDRRRKDKRRRSRSRDNNNNNNNTRHHHHHSSSSRYEDDNDDRRYRNRR